MRIHLKHCFHPLLRPLLAATALLVAASSAEAAGYLKFEGIEGNARADEHKDWIVIQSMSSPIFRSISEDPDSPPRVEAGDFAVEMPLSKATPKLLEAACNGKVFPKVEIHLTEAGPDGERTYFMWELQNVQISSYSMSGADAAERPVELLSLNFEEIRAVHVDAGGGGKAETTWHVEKGEH